LFHSTSITQVTTPLLAARAFGGAAARGASIVLRPPFASAFTA